MCKGMEGQKGKIVRKIDMIEEKCDKRKCIERKM